MAFATPGGGLVWVLSGHNGKNVIRSEGSTSAVDWQAARDQAPAVGMVTS
jgi:hypothetical protein